jgi:hypothetical protein
MKLGMWSGNGANSPKNQDMISNPPTIDTNQEIPPPIVENKAATIGGGSSVTSHNQREQVYS